MHFIKPNGVCRTCLEGKPFYRSGEISFFAHATEDSERIVKKVSEALQIPQAQFKRTLLSGHFGNPIEFYEAKLSGLQANKAIGEILSSLSPSDRDLLSDSLPNFLDGHGNLYIRIDKQGLLQERTKLGTSEPVRIKFKPYMKGRSKLAENISLYKDLIARSSNRRLLK